MKTTIRDCVPVTFMGDVRAIPKCPIESDLGNKN